MRLRAAACLALACALLPCAARAQAPEAPDTSLHRFLESMADSTDAYFGLAATPADTTGLDSTLLARLEAPWRGPRNRQGLSVLPRYAFNRVDGSVWGGGVSWADRGTRLRLAGDVNYAQASEHWLGGGELLLGMRRVGQYARVRLRGGWRTATMDRDRDERFLATVRALLYGNDRQHYLHREGWSVQGFLWRPAWYGGVEWRDWVERPLVVTAPWALFGDDLEQPLNLAAAPGRAREIGAELGFRWPLVPLRTHVDHAVASRSLGGDFEFQRTRVAVGGEIPVTRHASLLPQLVYARLTGEATPQAAFYLGGPRTLRSLKSASLGGTGFGLARLDLMGAFNLLEVARIPHPAWLPLQIGAFAATGAVWGADPFGGPGSDEDNWPERNAWLGEAGASLLYRPGVPDQDGYLRLEHAWPLGPDGRTSRWTISYTRALDLLPAF